MKNQTLVSIVVPIYKVPEKYLKQCIESCINQTLKDVEIILVDDGSPDRCGEICDDYAKKDNRIKVIHKKNEGLAAARNSGVDACSGETFMFLDGDDYLDFDCCEKTYTTLKEKNVQMVLFNQKLVYSKKTIPSPVCDNEPELFRTNKECRELQARTLSFRGWMATATSKLVYLDFINKYNIRHNVELKQGVEGYIYNIMQFEYLESAYYMPTPFYNYVYNDESITHVPSLENNILMIRGLEFIDDFGKKHPVIPKFRQNLLNRVIYVAITTAIQGVFNPLSKLAYKEQKNWYDNYLKLPLVKEALHNTNEMDLDKQRRIVVFFIKHKFYIGLKILAIMRRIQLNLR